VKRSQEWNRMGKLRRPCDNPSKRVLNILKFTNFLRCDVIKKRVAVIKAISNECCSNGFGDWKRNIATITAKVTTMIEAASTCQRNKFSKLKIAIKCNTKITYSVWWCDVMTKDVRWQETGKFDPLFGCTYNDDIYCLSSSQIYHWDSHLADLQERSASAVDKDIYTWVSSAYKWWSNLWLWIRELSGAV